MHLKNYNLKILEMGPDICINFTSTESWNCSYGCTWQSGVHTTSLQSHNPAPSSTVVQDFTHVSPSTSPVSMVSPTTPVPFSHLLISYSFRTMVSLRPYHAYKNLWDIWKVPFPTLPLPEIQIKCTGMGSNTGIFYKPSSQLWNKHGGALKTTAFQLASAQPALVPAALTAPLDP